MTDNLPQTPARSDFRPTNGRKTKYNDRIAKQICLYVAEGMSLRKVSRQPGMPSWSVLKIWQIEHPELRQTLEAIRFLNATDYAAEALECYDDLNPASENIRAELAIAKAKAATLLGMARLHDLRNLPRPIQENEEC
ncbi:hypothetical protein K3H00_001977 [Escherichia coli]|uniref:terminase small subunit-like protein n=1 Tax=Escherichia coli TaxID=562 RepID=UPI00063D3C32|nr:hypothetical protein [Escherichia coli]EFD3951828.1 hypothetical protein [Escherichia coli]EHW6381304.1 hypothetical protein [Escherichia coli]EJC5429384.1 hypothetical protein [Escherichia coli]EJU9828367.1 hypothetical protein [Escherichia coli]KLG37936.1 hypothetical protein WQ86_02740 [Escherichia coli]